MEVKYLPLGVTVIPDSPNQRFSMVCFKTREKCVYLGWQYQNALSIILGDIYRL